MSHGSRVAMKMTRTTELGRGCPPVLRLGLATRGNTDLPREGVERAIAAGVNYLNWCGHEDAMSRTIAALSAAQRRRIVVATQLSARTAEGMARELDEVRACLGHERLDVATLYYVEHPDEWRQIAGRVQLPVPVSETATRVPPAALDSMNKVPVAGPMSRGRYWTLMSAESPIGIRRGVVNGRSSNSVVVDGSR